jgi:hypothetical protein
MERNALTQGLMEAASASIIPRHRRTPHRAALLTQQTAACTHCRTGAERVGRQTESHHPSLSISPQATRGARRNTSLHRREIGEKSARTRRKSSENSAWYSMGIVGVSCYLCDGGKLALGRYPSLPWSRHAKRHPRNPQ